MSDTGAETNAVEIIQVVNRKLWTATQKMSIVNESMQPGNSVSWVARKHGIPPAILYRWRKLVLEGGEVAITSDEQVISVSEVAALKKRINEPGRVLGKKTLEIEILKTAVELGRKKNDLSRANIGSRRFPVKSVADALSVSRSNEDA